MAYRVQLPVGDKIHNVFHVSQLKKKMDNQEVTSVWLEFMNETEEVKKKPIAILDWQLVKRFIRAGAKALL